ncbi:MAG: hypothetical protein CSA66_00070 [Proteobacteria bacterium]|nr:MAG: hypothetical protein CSA66_00070 [Pseudomonadota bacterium]
MKHPRLTTALTILPLCAALAAPAGCTDEGESSDARLAVAITTCVDDHIVPGFATLDERSGAYLSAATAFCQAPDEATLASLQGQWRALSEAWNRVSLYNLGPLSDDVVFPRIIFIDSMRLRGTDYTETVREALAVALAGDATLNVDYVAKQPFTDQGLLALEVLSFESTAAGHPTAAADVVADYTAQPRKCDYLLGVAGRLDVVIGEVLAGWRVDFADSGAPFRDAMVAGELPDGAEAAPALLLAIHEHLDYVKTRKLEGLLDARLADHFYANVRASLDALGELLRRDEAGDRYGLLDHMASRGFTDQVAAVEATLAAARAAADAEDRDALTAAFAALEGSFKRELPDGLDVDLGITFTDGD